MVEMAEPRSPLDGLSTPGQFGRTRQGIGVELSERLCASLVQVQAWPDTIAETKRAVEKVCGVEPLANHQVARTGSLVVMPTGPGRWLIEDESHNLETLLREAVPSTMGAVTGLTHARVVVTISGDKAEWVLASGIAIDFSANAFPVNTARPARHHEIGLTILRTGEDRFDLYVFTSLSRAFWQWITRASAEVGYTVS